MADSFQLKNGSLFVVAEAVAGVYNAEQLKVLAEISDSESAILKATEDQTIGFVVSEDKLGGVEERLRESGLIPKHYRRQQTPTPRACLGELCPHFEQDALGDALEVSAQLVENFPNGAPHLRIAMNGCSQNCLASGTDDMHIVGEPDGYKIQLGGKSAELPQVGQFFADNVKKEELAGEITRIIETFVAKREENESFHDFVERLGTSEFEASASTDTPDSTEMSSEASDVPDLAEDLDPEVDLAEVEDLSDSNGLAPDVSESLLDDSESALEDDSLESEEFSMEDANSLLSTDDETGDESPDPEMNTAPLESAELESTESELGETDLPPEPEPDLSEDVTGDLELDGVEDLDGEAELDTTDLDVEAPLENEDTLATDAMSEADPHDELEEAAEGDSFDVDAEVTDLDVDIEAIDDATFETDPESGPLALDANLSTDEVPVESDVVPDDNPETAAELMEGEYDLEEADATEEDVSRVTQAMRSEAALDQESSAGNVSPVNLADSFEAAESPDEESTDSSESSAANTEDVPDLPRSFLSLQDQAADAGSLQVKLIEDTLCIVTPDDARLNLPFKSLRSGLKVVINVGSFSFSAVIQEDQLALRFGTSAISLPIACLEQTEQKAA